MGTPVVPGLVVVDKPAGWTSHDVVGKLRRIFGTRKVGHSGTLDPMATGVLVCGIGQATRLLSYVSVAGKEYDATIRLGLTTVTDDSEGELVAAAGAALALQPVAGVVATSESEIKSYLAQMVGEIDQRPSSVSAIKVDGERAYTRVRKGETVLLPTRKVTIHKIDIQHVRVTSCESSTGESLPVVDIDITVSCSSGTYIRAIARDLGEQIGVGGILTSLRRTSVGNFELQSARTLAELELAAADAQLSQIQVSLADSLAWIFPTLTLGEEEAAKFCHGGKISMSGTISQSSPEFPNQGLVGVLDATGSGIGVGELRSGVLVPKVVWPKK